MSVRRCTQKGSGKSGNDKKLWSKVTTSFMLCELVLRLDQGRGRGDGAEPEMQHLVYRAEVRILDMR